MGFIWWLIIGLIAGGLARLMVPGRQPMGLLMTMALGLVGSFVGGFISWAILGENPADPGIHAGGLIMSTLGAVITLIIYVNYAQKGRV